MLEQLEKIKSEAIQSIEQTQSAADLEKIRVHYFGKKGSMTALLHGLKEVSAEERPKLGQTINATKTEIVSLLDERIQQISGLEQKQKLQSEEIDITLPGIKNPVGRSHLISRTQNEIIKIFLDLGFSLEEGPDIENDFYNFEALNMPQDHPARDMWDTFYLKEKGYLLRTHTSPVQIRAMQKQKPPVRLIAPGRVYRRDDDVTHAPVFNQVEGLVVGKEINFSELKGILNKFISKIFDQELKTRFRPSFFPFTEPSAEMDVEWQGGWLEILGCGMVDPNVLKAVNVDSEEYTGYAFGLGVERITMLKYGINDIRHFNQNDIRFLRQF